MTVAWWNIEDVAEGCKNQTERLKESGKQEDVFKDLITTLYSPGTPET